MRTRQAAWTEDDRILGTTNEDAPPFGRRPIYIGHSPEKLPGNGTYPGKLIFSGKKGLPVYFDALAPCPSFLKNDLRIGRQHLQMNLRSVLQQKPSQSLRGCLGELMAASYVQFSQNI